MDVMRLDSNWVGDIPIEGFSSMIWTERYEDPGDFELVTPLVDQTRKQLPLFSVISLRDAEEVMVVYSHEIKVNDDGLKELTVKGETFETFLRKRVMIGGRVWTENRNWTMRKKYTPGEAAAAIIWNHVIDNDPWVLRQVWILEGGTPAPPDKGNINDLIPNLYVSDSSTLGSKRWRQISLGSVFSQLEKQLKVGGLAVRNIRPTGKTINNLFRLDSEGVVQTFSQTLSGSLQMDIYNGRDRSVNQDLRDQVVFRYDAGHLVNPSYLWSVKGNTNIVAVDSPYETHLVFGDGVNTNAKGFDRRVDYATVNFKDDDVVEITDPYAGYDEVGLRVMRRQPPTKVFDAGQVSPDSPYTYGVDYFLGDEVTVRAEYGLEQTMRVAEYIRTYSAENGEANYPTLVASD